MGSCQKMGGFQLFSVVHFAESDCFIVANLKGRERSAASRGEARIFPEVRTNFKIPSIALSPLNLEPLALYLLYHWPDDTMFYASSP